MMTSNPRRQIMRDLYTAKYGSRAAADARLAEEARQDAIDAAELRRRNRQALSEESVVREPSDKRRERLWARVCEEKAKGTKAGRGG